MLFILVRSHTNVPPPTASWWSTGSGRAADGHPGFRLVSDTATFVWPFPPVPPHARSLAAASGDQGPRSDHSQGEELPVHASVQIRTSSDEESRRNAAEQLLGRSLDDVDNFTRATLEGSIREIGSRLSIEEINSDRARFKRDVQKVATTDLSKMGLGAVSLVINGIDDEGGCIKSLCRAETARVQAEDEIGETEDARDASIRTAEAMKEGEVRRPSRRPRALRRTASATLRRHVSPQVPSASSPTRRGHASCR